MIFELFNTITGKTVDYIEGEAAARRAAEVRGGGFDFERAAPGFYVRQTGGNGTSRIWPSHYQDRRDAERKSDFENMASDASSFDVVAQH